MCPLPPVRHEFRRGGKGARFSTASHLVRVGLLLLLGAARVLPEFAFGGGDRRPLRRFLLMERVGSVLDVAAVLQEHDAAGA